MSFRLNPILRSPDPIVDEGKSPGTGEVQFSEAQLKALGSYVNAAITSHKDRGPKLEEQLKSFNWAELLAPVVKTMIPVADDNSNPDPKKPALSDFEKQLAKMNQELESERKLRIEAENKRKTAEETQRTESGRMKLRSALSSHVLDGAVDHAVNHLTLVKNKLVVDEDGTVKIKVMRPEFAGFPPAEVIVPLEDGIKDVLSESDMKIFVHAPKGNGSNPGPNGGKQLTSASFVGEAKTDAEKLQRASIREAELIAKYGNR